MTVDYVGFYIEHLTQSVTRFVDGYGFAVRTTRAADCAPNARSVTLGQGQIRLLLVQPLVADHPASAYLERHGDGVADIGIGVADAAATFDECVRRGARPVSGPVARDGDVRATIMGCGDVTHTFVQRDSHDASPDGAGSGAVPGLTRVDHFAVCLEPGQLGATVDFYQEVLDFDRTLHERIVIGSQAMSIEVVESGSGAVTLTLIEPDVSRPAGHLEEFLKNHGGTGVQHLAFATGDIVKAVDWARARGVEFLDTPETYYTLLLQRLRPSRHPVEELRRLSVLVDQDHDGQLYQIFTRSVHPRETFFMEIIERVGAQSFGSGNIKSLYQAVELQRGRSGPVL